MPRIWLRGFVFIMIPRAKYLIARVSRQFRCFRNGLRFGVLYLRDRTFTVPQTIRVNGTRIALQLPPEGGVAADFFVCFLRNEYGLNKQLDHTQTIVDIGSNLGFFSIAARSYYPNATIQAYEPNPRIVPLLRQNVSQLGITIYPEAVGGECGCVEIVDSGDCNQARTATSQNGSIQQVSLATAVARIGGTVDLLKLDCEGAEWDMFCDAKPWHSIRDLRMEYHLFHGKTVQDLLNALHQLDFQVLLLQQSPGFGTVWATRAK